ncbi:peptide ABC transporter substrate-binding protein [Candidatus Parabeggiatoa sp. HSG14]|uniref:peptide ABC transporter substrate-binding protein n=1 Tax=Candidatus Parabeggiatoa sp. HSG14 TaxID=3055593 RepID=UPI0025A6BD69|nr:peptide ABC transporter substrate-binding protein [Thiotrichales bacterium HSG14]
MFSFFKLIFIIWFFIITITSSYGNSKQSTQQNTQPKVTEAQPKHPNYLRLPLKSAIKTIDPGLIFDLSHIEIVEQLFLGLTDFDPKTYEVLPELARNWRVNENSTVYTFFLRQDVKWSDGNPVTAHDIVWAIRRNITPIIESPYAHTLYILKNAEAIHHGEITSVTQLGVRAIDDYTVEFTLEHAAGYFPALASIWTYRPLPQKSIKQYGERWIEPEHIQTNGSYRLTEWDKGNKLILKKNPHYYEAKKVKIPEVHYFIVRGNSLALAMYEKDDLDIIGGQVYLRLPSEEISRIKSHPVLRKERQINDYFCTEWYGFNTQRFPMNKSLVRKAIAAVIDKKTLLNVVIKESHLPATTFTRPPIFGAINPKEKEVGILFNPKKAKAWLAEAGYPEGRGFPKVILMYNTSKTHQKVAKAIKTLLKYYLNIDIEIQQFDFIPYINMLNQSIKPHIFRMGWCADYPDAHNWLYDVFHPKNGINWINWNHREFTNVVNKAQQISNPAERKKLYYRAEQILTEEEVAIIPLYFSNIQFLVKPWVKNWYPMAFGGQHIRYWALEN